VSEVEVYTGHFGSGKTEIVLNRAVELAAAGETVHVVDLDIVKPYFRSREVRSFLQELGINLVMPQGELSDADLPVVAPQVLGTLTSAAGRILFDVGGDPMGATALGSFAAMLRRRGYRMFFVLNPYRPFTRDVPTVRRMLEDIEAASRLEVSGLVSNPNLGRETTLADLRAGYPLVQEIAAALGLPILLTAVTERFASDLAGDLTPPVQKVTNYLLPPWELDEGQVFQIDPHLRIPQRGGTRT